MCHLFLIIKEVSENDGPQKPIKTLFIDDLCVEEKARGQKLGEKLYQFVKIDLFEGRSEEQKIELAREVTEVVSRVAKAPKEAIHVFINDMPEGTYYPHGEMKKKN